jgi:flagellar L-ring protein precursor FlgH
MKHSRWIAAAAVWAGAVGLVRGGDRGDASSTSSPSGASTGDAATPLNNDTPARVGALMQQTGVSLLKASLAVRADPSQAKLSDISFFAVAAPEPHTLKKHDLVTIIIREESEINSTADKDFKREADLTAKLDQFIQLDLRKFAIRGFTTSQSPADIDINGIREFKGNGEMDRTDSLTARITAEVLDVKPNGTLVLQARKSIKTDEEEQQFILSGQCRAADVSTDNTVLSTQIFDLELQKNHKGDVKKAVTRDGWAEKLMDLINPF